MDLEMRQILIDRMTDNLPVLRKKLRLTQEDLALRIGSSRGNVMQMETGRRKMTWNTFLSLVLVFEKNPETAQMLRMFQIYTTELDNALSGQTNTNR
jgi:DNA-binding XRE family transcriptional regulator